MLQNAPRARDRSVPGRVGRRRSRPIPPDGGRSARSGV